MICYSWLGHHLAIGCYGERGETVIDLALHQVGFPNGSMALCTTVTWLVWCTRCSQSITKLFMKPPNSGRRGYRGIDQIEKMVSCSPRDQATCTANWLIRDCHLGISNHRISGVRNFLAVPNEKRPKHRDTMRTRTQWYHVQLIMMSSNGPPRVKWFGPTRLG